LASHPALGPTGHPPLELRQIEVEGHPGVVQDELTADDHETLNAHPETTTAAAAPPEPGDVVTPGALGRVGKGTDPEPQSLDPHPGEDEAVPAQGGQTGTDSRARHLEEGWRVRGRPIHPEPEHFDLEREGPETEPLDLNSTVEVAAEGVLDEARAPPRGSPQRVEEGDSEDEEEEEECPST
jgi:hypothetical protein